MKVAPDIPQWILDMFNQIDFKQVGELKKKGIRIFISIWAKNNLPQKQPNVTYKSTGRKKISNDFDLELLDILNDVDFESITNDKITIMKNFLTGYIKQNLPMKKKQ